jgi:DinB superfamily
VKARARIARVVVAARDSKEGPMTDAPRPLAPDAVAALLRGAAATFAAESRALPEPVRRWHPAAAEWCVKEVLGHIIEAERRGFAGRIRIILAAGEPPLLERWDQAAVARERKDCERDVEALLDELFRMREDSAALAASLRPAELTRSGLHPVVGELTVADLLQEWVHHDRNHARQIMANVQAYAWPHMGNAQKFSTG